MAVNGEMPDATLKLYDAFISHSRHDSEVAIRLANELEQADFSVWLDKREVLVGHNIVERVDLGIAESRFMIVLHSTSSIESEWVKREWTAAYITEIESKDVVILPVLLEPCEIPPVLRTKRYADLTVWNAGIGDIVNAMQRHGTSLVEPARKPTQLGRAIIESPVHFAPTATHKPLSELFIGGVLFSGIPKARIRNVSLLIQIGGRVNVVINLDQEDIYLMGGVAFPVGLTWQWDQECQSIPCLVVDVDMRTGEQSSRMLPTYYQVSRLLTKLREVIFLFIREDSSQSDIVGVGIGSKGRETLALQRTHLSFVV